MGASILNDPLPFDDRVNAELLALLDHHRTVIRRYPKIFVCLVGLSRSFNDVLVRPTLLKDDESDIGLLDFVKSSDLLKVKTGERTLAEGEIPLNDETMNMIVPPSAKIRLRANAATASEAVPTTCGKSTAALKRLELQTGPQGVGSSFIPPPVKEFVSSFVTPTPEPDAPKDSRSTQDGGVQTHRASMVVVVSSSSRPNDEVTPPGVEDTIVASVGGQTIETAIADNIYVLEWGVTNGTRIDNPTLYHNLLDHITPPGYWAMLRNLSPAAFLDSFKINSAQHTCMIFELRLQLEKAKLEATKVVSLRGRVSELAVKSQEVVVLGKQNAELLSKVSALKLREEFKSFQDAKARRFEQNSAKLDARIADVRPDMDNDLYPYMFTAIAGRRKVWKLELSMGNPGKLWLSGEVLLSEVIPTARAAAERRGLCPRPVGGTSSFALPYGSSLGITYYPVSTFVLSSDGEPTTQPLVMQAHDDLFDTSVFYGAGGA
ncbi:hypothetical protein Tco_0040533 [Tanacetum coccineum]